MNVCIGIEKENSYEPDEFFKTDRYWHILFSNLIFQPR